jgi:two-component system, LytTR family, sensor kinase
MKKSVFYFLHAFIILIFVLTTVSNLRAVSSHCQQPILTSLLDGIFENGSMLGLIYLSYWLFIPQYLVKREYLKFFSGILIIILGFSLYLNLAAFFISKVPFLKSHAFDNGWQFGLVAGWAFFFFLVGTLFRLFIQWLSDYQYKSELEKQNIRSELSLLKNQINPHFLFNSLNNIDSLIGDTSPDASRALSKLSDIMRYMVYDSEKEYVPLKDEISYVRNYIDLQKLRIPNADIIKFSINGEITDQQVAPMIFIPFVENAFKHSSLKDKPDNTIEIKFDITSNKISFYCFNTVKEIVKDDSSGIGLDNVRKRLGLIYKDTHKLKISNLDKSFSVYLDINL